MDPEVEMKRADEAIGVMESASSLINTNEENTLIQQIVQNLEPLVDDCLVLQKQVHVCIQGLREKVKAKDGRILNAQKSNLKDEDLKELRNNLAEARIEEDKARATARSMEEHLDGLAEQLQSVEAQKQTLASLASEETQLKSELSLFSTISDIIPNMARTDVFAGNGAVQARGQPAPLEPVHCFSVFQPSSPISPAEGGSFRSEDGSEVDHLQPASEHSFAGDYEEDDAAHEASEAVADGSSTNGGSNRECCSICMDYIHSFKGVVGDCRHSYCWKCILPWALFNITCPLCKQVILSIDKVSFSGLLVSSLCGDIGGVIGGSYSSSSELTQTSSSDSVGDFCQRCRSAYLYDLVTCPMCGTCQHSYCNRWYCSTCSGYGSG